MSDKEARALGAGGSVEVEGVEYKISPISMRALHEIQRAAVAYCKREYLRTYVENADLLPRKQRDDMLKAKLEEVARWDVGDLPHKTSYDVRAVPLKPELIVLLEKEYGQLPDAAAQQRAVLATALDSGAVKSEQVEKLTGTKPKRVRVPYDTWWITAVYDGMITFVLASVEPNHPNLTKREVGEWPLAKIAEAARLAEQLTAPAVGNM